MTTKAELQELRKLQKRIARHQVDLDERNTLLASLNDQGITHRALAEELSTASGRPVVEDTVQKAIRKHRSEM